MLVAAQSRGRLSFNALTQTAIVLLCVATPGAVFAQSFERVSIETTASIDHFSNDDAATRPQIIFDVAATVRLGAGWEAYIRPWFRLPRTPDWDTQIYQAAVRYQRRGAVALQVDAGYIASPIGLGMLDTGPSVNPMIGPHVSYFAPMRPFDTGGPRVLAVASTYPLGAQLSLSGTRWDTRIAAVNATPTRISVLGGAVRPRATGVIEAGAGVTPTTGLRIGVSFARGHYLTQEEFVTTASASRSVTIVGFEGEYAFGYTKVSGEWIHDAFDTPSTSEAAHTWFLQGMHTLSPRWYVAGRREATSSPIRGSGVSLASHPALQSGEVTVGYRLTPSLTLKSGWTASRSYGQAEWTHRAGVGLVWNQRWR